MLVINPAECIDCGVCEPECPAEAIIPDTVQGSEKWVEINQQFAGKWPNITRKGQTPADADEWLTVPNKFQEHFSANPPGDTSPKEGDLNGSGPNEDEP